MTEQYKGIQAIRAASQADWRNWLEKNHQLAKNVWLIIYKKESGVASVYHPEAVDEALCFGWVDSKANKRDESSYYQFFSQRNPKSNWSKVNKEKVARLTREGRMAAAGLEMVALAKKNSTWTALDQVESLVLPDDLRKALAANKKAYAHWEAFPKSVKRGILEWILNAKKPETRQKRIEETVALAALNQRANQYRP